MVTKPTIRVCQIAEAKVSLPRPGSTSHKSLRRRTSSPSSLFPLPSDFPPTPCSQASGFTLLELMIVMVIIGILAAIAIPSFTQNVKHAREAVLREDLQTMRGAIQQFTYDKQKAPQDGADLVSSGYLKVLPVDPFTQRSDTWIFDQGSSYTSIDETQSGGIDDVHSGSQQVSTEGTTYSTW